MDLVHRTKLQVVQLVVQVGLVTSVGCFDVLEHLPQPHPVGLKLMEKVVFHSGVGDRVEEDEHGLAMSGGDVVHGRAGHVVVVQGFGRPIREVQQVICAKSM
eukprot:167500-Chlamydomonas_euryale.AAC.1